MTKINSASFPALFTPDTAPFFEFLGADNLRFVGGCVRNALLGEKVTDIDFATKHPPEKVMEILRGAGIKVIPTGIDHGTVTAVLNGASYEITTLRRDVATDGRRAVIAYTDDWAEDAARRDFTINALYADSNGRIDDPTGLGLFDLSKRKIRFIGSADLRVREDYLRILRFFRFYGAYGKGSPDKDALSACAKYAGKIATLSRERVTQEFTKILMGERADKVLSLLRDHDILTKLIGKSYDAKRFGILMKLEKTVQTGMDDVFFLARILMGAGGLPRLPKKAHSLLIFNKKQECLLREISKIKINTKRLDNLEFQKLLYLFERDSVATVLLLEGVREGISARKFSKIWQVFSETERPVFPVSGKDILGMSIPSGPEMGKILKRLESRWMKSGFSLPKKKLLDKLR